MKTTGGRKLNIPVPDLDLEVFFVRAQNIPVLIDSGAVDFGIAGRDVEAEAKKHLSDILDLDFGQCKLSIAAPEFSPVAAEKMMRNGIRVATPFLNLIKRFINRRGIKADIVFIAGSG